MDNTACGIMVFLVVCLGAFLTLFFTMGYSEIRKNNVFLPANCTTISSEVVPYRSCSKACQCSECDISSNSCASYEATDANTDRYDISESLFDSLDKPCCNGYYCCQTECETCTSCSSYYSCSRRRLQGAETPGSHEEFLEFIFNHDTGKIGQFENGALPEDLDQDFIPNDEEEYFAENYFEFGEDDVVINKEFSAQIAKKTKSSSSKTSCKWRTSCHSYECNCVCVHDVANRACHHNCQVYYESQIEMEIEIVGDTEKYSPGALRIDDFGLNQVEANDWVNEFRFQPESVFSCYIDPDWDFKSTKISPSDMALEEELGYTWWKWLLIGIPFAFILLAIIAATERPLKKLCKSSLLPPRASKKWVPSLQWALWFGTILPLCFLFAIATMRLLPETSRTLRAFAFASFGIGWIFFVGRFLKDSCHHNDDENDHMAETIEAAVVMAPFYIGMSYCALESKVLPGFVACTLLTIILLAIFGFVNMSNRKSPSFKESERKTSVVHNMMNSYPVQTFDCDICNITGMDQASHQSHMNGRKHKNALARIPREINSFDCDICNISGMNEASYQQHVNGRKHKNKIKSRVEDHVVIRGTDQQVNEQEYAAPVATTVPMPVATVVSTAPMPAATVPMAMPIANPTVDEPQPSEVPGFVLFGPSMSESESDSPEPNTTEVIAPSAPSFTYTVGDEFSRYLKDIIEATTADSIIDAMNRFKSWVATTHITSAQKTILTTSVINKMKEFGDAWTPEVRQRYASLLYCTTVMDM